nr:hypothetical protein [Bacilli bacterium]
YQALEDVKDDKQLAVFGQNMKDVYGKIPKEVELLIQKKRIDLLTEEEEFKSIEELPNQIDIYMSDRFSRINGIGATLFEKLIPWMKVLRVSFVQKQLRICVKKEGEWMDALEKIVKTIHKVYLTYKTD